MGVIKEKRKKKVLDFNYLRFLIKIMVITIANPIPPIMDAVRIIIAISNGSLGPLGPLGNSTNRL